MVKIYKQKDKLILYLPQEVIKSLDLGENEEVDFFKLNSKSFMFAKKSDAANLLLGKQAEEDSAKPSSAIQPKNQFGNYQLSAEQITVLKKLDTIRYNVRTKDNVDKLLSESEKSTLNQLLKQKAVNLFKSDKAQDPLYGISKSVYDKFLMRKNSAIVIQQPQPSAKAAAPARAFKIPLLKKSADDNPYVIKLEENGFLVLQTEAEASSMSLALEESIRQGFVLGTRAFNRKFYIVLRTFIEKNSANIVKAIRSGSNKVSEIAKEANIDEDGTRAILYLLSESGDVSEKRRDYFVIA